MLILLAVLQSLVVVVHHHFARYGAHLVKLISLAVRLGHCDLILRVKRHLGVTALHLGHERRRERRLPLGRLGHRRKVLLVTLV